jgi:hypothetical protein
LAIRAGETGDGAVTDAWASAETADAIRASLARTTGKAG